MVKLVHIHTQYSLSLGKLVLFYDFVLLSYSCKASLSRFPPNRSTKINRILVYSISSASQIQISILPTYLYTARDQIKTYRIINPIITQIFQQSTATAITGERSRYIRTYTHPSIHQIHRQSISQNRDRHPTPSPPPCLPHRFAKTEYSYILVL